MRVLPIYLNTHRLDNARHATLRRTNRDVTYDDRDSKYNNHCRNSRTVMTTTVIMAIVKAVILMIARIKVTYDAMIASTDDN